MTQIQSRVQSTRGGFTLLSPEFCERWCPVCTRARRGVAWAVWLQRLEMVLTFGGCPWGRARKRKYGVPPNVPVPEQPRQN